MGFSGRSYRVDKQFKRYGKFLEICEGGDKWCNLQENAPANIVFSTKSKSWKWGACKAVLLKLNSRKGHSCFHKRQKWWKFHQFFFCYSFSVRPRLRLHHQVQVLLHHCRQPQLQGRRHPGRSDQGQLHRLCRHQKQLQQLKIPKSLEMIGKLNKYQTFIVLSFSTMLRPSKPGPTIPHEACQTIFNVARSLQ